MTVTSPRSQRGRRALLIALETVAFLHAHTDGPRPPGASAQW